MKLSLNLAQEFSSIDLTSISHDELLKRIGEQLGAVEDSEDWSIKYTGALVAKVVSCVKHADSDHLNVCMIDDGGVTEGVDRDEDGNVQVVCGAPNARAGITVAWIPPGAIVPKTYGTDSEFRLETREIRGLISNGMLASPSELALSEDHEGILEIEETEVGIELVKPGTEFVKLYGLGDFVVDCENKMFTHRPDCFGNIGIARELAAIAGEKFVSPEWYSKIPVFGEADGESIELFNEAPEQVSRIMAVAMKNVKVGPSPVWLQSVVTRLGGKPVNNVVDVSNYVMYLTGQPTHAYDLGKINGDKIGARFAKQGETIKLLNGKLGSLTEEDIVIADDKAALGIAGVMGGSDTEVDENTTNILLEVASFDMYTVRKTAMRHGLFTDAFTRFSKGQSPLQNDRVLYKLMELLTEIAGAVQSGKVVDLRPENTETLYDRQFIHDPVEVSVDFINSRLGVNLKRAEIEQILRNVEMAVNEAENGDMEVTAPYWRTDIALKEDIVEEIGRLYGYDKVDIELPLRSTKATTRNDFMSYRQKIRTSLAAAGATEVLTYSFVHGDLIKKAGGDPSRAFHIRNALSPDLQYYRTSLIPSLLSKVQTNIKSDLVRSEDNEFAIFEIGRAHVKEHNDEDGLPAQMERVALVFAADEKTAIRKYHGSAMYMAKQYLLPLLSGQVDFMPLTTNDHPIISPYELKRSATISIDGNVLGVVGEFKNSVKKSLKLPNYCAGFEVDLSLLKSNTSETPYQPIATFPKTQQDITLKVSPDKKFADILRLIRTELSSQNAEHGYEYLIAPKNIYQAEGVEYVNYTFRIWLWHPAKTLKTEEANKILESISENAKKQLGALEGLAS